MKITRKMLHEDLQRAKVFYPQMLLKYLMRSRRGAKLINKLGDAMAAGKLSEGVVAQERFLPTSDGEGEIRVKIYRPKSFVGTEKKLPPMLYTHGGGYVMGSPELADSIVTQYIERRPCVIVAPAYRRAMEKPYPAAFDDCYMTLLWMRDNADELGIDAKKFIIAGHSAGGGLTAAVTLKARDTRDVAIAFQMPFYPMLDDKQPQDPERFIDVPGWDTKANAFGWGCYLGKLRESGAEIPAYAAPARNTNYEDFPPTISFIGEYEPFYWETVEYVERLKTAGVDVAFKVFEKCTHGPDMTAADTSLGKECLAFQYSSFADFYDRYICVE